MVMGNLKSYKIEHSEKLVGQIISTKTDIYGDQFTTSKYIKDIQQGFFPYDIYLYLGEKQQYKASGNFVQYNLKEKKVRWDHEYNFNLQAEYIFSDSTIFFTDFNKSWKVDYNTGGKELWNKGFKISYLSEKLNLAVGIHQRNAFSIFKLKGFNLANGEELWSEDLTGLMGWSQFILVNDSIGILINKGIIKLNLNTGRIWQNQDIIKTRESDYRNFNINKVKNINSEIILDKRKVSYHKGYIFVDNSCVYVIKDNELACISIETGETIWRNNIDFYGDIQIGQNADEIYILQKDFRLKLQFKARFFIINKSNGKLTNRKNFSDLKLDFRIMGDKIFFLAYEILETVSSKRFTD
jgi:outer membrane protein assembly factor BamB